MTNTDTLPAPARTRWPDWIGYAAAAWAGLYTVLALMWTVTGSGFPYGTNDPRAMGPLRQLPPDVGAPAFAGVLLLTTVVALVMAGSSTPAGHRLTRWSMTGFGWLVAAALLAVVPDTRVLTLLGYAPMIIIGAPFGWPSGVDYSTVFTWPLLNHAYAVIGGFLVAGTVLAWQRRGRAACGACGRGPQPSRWASPGAAARWGRWAAYLAAAVPFGYAVTRFAWLVGVPVGISEATLQDLHDTGAVWGGAGLGAFATVGAVLTLGLVRPWGERFPRWMVGLAGRRVPVALAVAPALVVSVVVTAAATSLLSEPELLTRLAAGEWVILPFLFWPLWGIALAAAACAYYLRRRGRCARCGRG